MKNIALFEKLANGYHTLAYTDNYILGFQLKGSVYFVTVKSEDFFKVCKLDLASRGCGYALRYCPTTAQKMFLMTKNPSLLCSVEFFNAEYETSYYNRGEIFEKLVTEHFGQQWVKDTVPFTEDGDLTVNGVAFQLKYEKATLTNEKTLSRQLSLRA